MLLLLYRRDPARAVLVEVLLRAVRLVYSVLPWDLWLLSPREERWRRGAVGQLADIARLRVWACRLRRLRRQRQSQRWQLLPRHARRASYRRAI